MSTAAGETNTGTNALVGWTYFQPMTGNNGTLVTPTSCFGSAHTGGMNFVMGDGSVRFISLDIAWGDTSSANTNPQTFNILGGARDGRVITGDY
jgi:prepilin-type processing-associated H-X9-DG protein